MTIKKFWIKWGGMLAITLTTAISQAQTFSVIRNFNGAPNDGATPSAGLTLSGSVLYGTTYQGGTSGYGTVFKVNTDGTGYVVLKNFSFSDGVNPIGRLTLSGSVLYGTTENGGPSGKGTVFKVNTDGSGFTVLKNFTSFLDGARPRAGLTLSGGTLYGTTAGDNGPSYGTVFKVNTDGTGYVVLKNFFNYPNTNAYSPQAELTLSGSTLYGTTYYGGSASSSAGSVFKINTDGTGYAELKSFNFGFFSDGAYPLAGLTLSGNMLYGTTSGSGGGAANYGTVFKLNTDGSGFSVLKYFPYNNGSYPINGAIVNSRLTLSGSTLYGTTSQGGSYSNGTAFMINTNGTGYSVLKNFSKSYDGANPSGGLAFSDSTLYGTTPQGGSLSNGTIYKIVFPIPPSITNTFTGATLFAGTSTNFAVGVDGAAPFSYQWYSNSVPLVNATNAALAFAPAATNQTANYFVIVTNAYGSVTSSVVALTVIAQNPIITSQPADQTLVIGNIANFTVAATGVPPLGYRWYFNNGLFPGATNATLTFGPTLTNQVGNYQVIITNLYGSATSRVALLTVLLQPNAYGISNAAANRMTLSLASIPGSTNRVWSSTNLALPLAQWQPIATNIADTNGLFQITDTNLNGRPLKFYRVSTP